MVVGNGLIASAFSCFKHDDDVIVFASGVSNSGETDPAAFKREAELLKHHLAKKTLLVYFSTFSVYDKSLKDSAYVKHKLSLEQLVEDSGSPYIIFRLPIMVGPSRNPNTLINFLYQQIKDDLEFELHARACRYLLGTSDLESMVPSMIKDRRFWNGTHNFCTTPLLSALEIVRGLETVIGKPAKFSLIEKGDCYQAEISPLVLAHSAYRQRQLSDLLSQYYA